MSDDNINERLEEQFGNEPLLESMFVFAEFPAHAEGVVFPLEDDGINNLDEAAAKAFEIHQIRLSPATKQGKQGYRSDDGVFFLAAHVKCANDLQQLLDDCAVGTEEEFMEASNRTLS